MTSATRHDRISHQRDCSTCVLTSIPIHPRLKGRCCSEVYTPPPKDDTTSAVEAYAPSNEIMMDW